MRGDKGFHASPYAVLSLQCELYPVRGMIESRAASAVSPRVYRLVARTHLREGVMTSKVVWTLHAFETDGTEILSRQAELDLDSLDEETIGLHAERFLAFLKLSKVGPGVRIAHEIDASLDVRARLVKAVERLRSLYQL